MNEIIAFLSKEKIEFYDKKGDVLENPNFEKSIVYAVLPDEYFFFFQSDITSKRRASLTIEAYAKSIFPVEENFVGYVGFALPLIGYVCFLNKIPEEFAGILEKAEVITSPFAVYLQSNKDAGFVYKGDSIFAAYIDSNLKHYTYIDENSDSKKAEFEKAKEIEFSKDEVVKKISQAISSNSANKINLPINKDKGVGFEGWKIYRFVILFIASLLFIAGGVVRYSFYKNELNNINDKIDALYKKALGGKHYNDPYGVLLYKAQSSLAADYSVAPLKLIYALSKAKNGYDIKIDYLSFSKDAIKVTGKIDSYTSLVKYTDNLNRLLGKNFVIQNTSSKNGKLLFTLTFKAAG